MAQLSAVIQAKDIGGLTPVLDRRQVANPFAVDGRNFIFSAQGPYSGLARRLASKNPIIDPRGIESFETDDGSGFVFTSTGILAYDQISDTFFPVYTFATTPTVGFAWSYEFMSGKNYFCRRGVGVLEYDGPSQAWTLIVSDFMPSNPCAICQTRSRLIILGDDSWAWSAQDDARDLEPSLLTGAGNQSIALIGGSPLSIQGIADAYLVFTTTGIALSEFNGSQAVYRHRVLSTKFKAISPLVITLLEDGITLFIDKRGFFTCDGQKPQIWQPAFSEFMANKLIQPKFPTGLGDFRLYVDDQRKWVCLLTTSTGTNAIYDKTWIMYQSNEKWGSLDDPHFGFIKVVTQQGQVKNPQLAVVNIAGYAETFSDENYIEGLPDLTEVIHWNMMSDLPTYIQDGVIHFGTTMNMEDGPLSELLKGLTSGYYTIDISSSMQTLPSDVFDPNAVPGTPIIFATEASFGDSGGPLTAIASSVITNGLGASVSIGLTRFNQLQHEDELGLVTSFSVWNDPVGTGTFKFDWNILNGAEDWDTQDGQIDYGFGITTSDQFTAELLGTNDGYTDFGNPDGNVTLVYGQNNESRYVCQIIGQFNLITVNALEYPETFHLKSVEFTGTPAGRL